MDAALQRYNAERLPDIKALLNVSMMWSAAAGMRVEVCQAAGLHCGG